MSARRVSRSLCTAALAAVTLVVGLVTPAAAVAAPQALVATITGMSPSSGPVGSKIAITGTGFTAPTAVVFTGASVQLASLRSSTSLGVTVPAGVSTGPVSVRFADGSVSAGTFTVTVGILVGPRSGAAGSSTTVKGSGYAAGEKVAVTAGSTTLTHGLRASATGTFSAVALVPAGTPLGLVTITATGVTSGRTSHAQYSVGWDWPSEGGDPANTRWNPFERVLTPSTVAGGLAARWTYAASMLAGAPPAVAGGRVFVATTDHRLHAVDATTGADLWSAVLGHASPSTPAVVGDIVYAVGEQQLTARDATTGAVRWTAPVPRGSATSPVVAGGRVYIGDYVGRFLCFDAATGSALWTVETDGPLLGTAAVVGGTVYFGADDGRLRALDAATGATRWSVTSDGGPVGVSGFYGTPAVADGVVYASDAGGTVFALRATDGRTVWTSQVSDQDMDALAVAGGLVYTTSREYEVRALDARTGAVRWSRRNVPTANTPYRVPSAPSVAGGVVYVISPDTVIDAFDARRGTPLWRHAPGTDNGGGVAAPVVSNGLLYVTGFNTRLVAFGPAG